MSFLDFRFKIYDFRFLWVVILEVCGNYKLPLIEGKEFQLDSIWLKNKMATKTPRHKTN